MPRRRPKLDPTAEPDDHRPEAGAPPADREAESPLEPAAVQPDEPSPSDSPRPSAPFSRAWTERHVQPVKYRHETAKDHRGAELILFRFDLPPGQHAPDQAVLDVMRDHQYFRDGHPCGLAADARSHPDAHPTGLRFGTVPKYGKAWVLPNDPFGRDVARSLDDALDGVAKRLEADSAARVPF